MWVNIVIGVLALMAATFTEAGAPAYIVAGVNAINMALRAITDRPVTL